MSRPSFKDCIPEFERQLSDLEQLAAQSAVHRKKFEFAVNQFRRFLISFSASATDDYLTDSQAESYRNACEVIREVHQLLCQHQLHCWAHTTLENPCSSVATTLCTLTDRMKKCTSQLSEASSRSFETDSPQWLQYHILDLKCIEASFQQYLENSGEDDQVAPMIIERLESVNAFLKEYENEQVGPGVRVFSPIPVVYQQWRLNHDDFECIKEVGSGVSSHVFYGIDKRPGHEGNELAIKRLKFKKLGGSKLQAFQREVSVLATASHPCLLGFVGATDTPPFCIVTEWMPGDTLYHEIHKKQKLDATDRTIVAFDIARGMQFLHSKHIIHRDLKTLNVMLDKNGHAKIGDFGFSRDMGEEELYTQNVGTPHWMAPELLASTSTYNSKIDVYAYGIVLWELETSQLPYKGLESAQIIAQVMMNDLRPTIPESTNGLLRDLITACWDRNPDRRPSFDEIIRRFQSGPIVLNGADREKFQEYIKEQIGNGPSKEVEIENKLNTIEDDEAQLRDLIDTLEKDGIPNDFIQRCWDTVEKNLTASPETVGRAAALFLPTTFKAKAAAVLRSLPPGTAPTKALATAVELIPSGSVEFDDDICVAACKNGAADVCVVYAVNPPYLKLALEIVAQQGAAQTLKAAVADRCVQCLSSTDSATVCSAIRCLIGIGDAKRITQTALKTQLQSREKALKNCTYVAAAAMSLSGSEVPVELVDSIIQLLDKESFAITVVIAVCKSPQVALQVVNRIAYGKPIKEETAMRILLAAAQHEELRPAVMVALGQIDFSNASPYIKEALSSLQHFVSQE